MEYYNCLIQSANSQLELSSVYYNIKAIMRKSVRKIDVLHGLIATILKNYFGFTDRSRLCAHTYCEVDYFRKDPDDARPRQMKS